MQGNAGTGQRMVPRKSYIGSGIWLTKTPDLDVASVYSGVAAEQTPIPTSLAHGTDINIAYHSVLLFVERGWPGRPR